MSERRGSIWRVDFEARGTEFSGLHYAIVVSRKSDYGPSIVVPITTGGEFARRRGFTVSLIGFGLRTTGVALCHQVQTVDLRERRARFIENAPVELADAVAAVLSCITGG